MRAVRGHVYCDGAGRLHGTVAGGRFAPHRPVAGVTAAQLAGVEPADTFLGTVVSATHFTRYELGVVHTTRALPLAEVRELGALWDQRNELDASIRYLNGAAMTRLRQLVESGPPPHRAITVSGTSFEGRTELIAECDQAGATSVELVRDEDNQFDANAVEVRCNGHLIGYVPRALNTRVELGTAPIVKMETFRATGDGEERWTVRIRARLLELD